MWWLLFICVINVKTFEALASNNTGAVYDSEYPILLIIKIFVYVYFKNCSINMKNTSH